MALLNDINFKNVKGDLFGGVTAAVIALPMALAFGVASGAGAEAGLYGAVLIGLFAALFGSTPTLISEPTGPMTVVMTAVIANLIASNPENGMAMAFTVVVLAGVFQILFGWAKAGKYVTMMPYTVVSGFMSGIGIILIILQLAPFLGQATPSGGVLGTLSNLPSLIDNINVLETSLAVGTFALLMLFPKNLRRFMPPQLLALILGTVLTIMFLDTDAVRKIGEIPTGLPDIRIPVFTIDQIGIMVSDAIVLAVLGTIDALLTSVIAENLTKKESDPDKELYGQGLGNIASGLFGGIPGAGATMGTVVNIQTGASSALSGITRAIVLLIVVLWLAELTAEIPLAILAGIALKVGFDIIDWSFIKRAFHVSKKAAIIMYAVIFLTVFVDLIAAVLIGVFIANMLTVERFSKMQQDSVKAIMKNSPRHPKTDSQRMHGQVLVMSLGGPLFFGVAKAISRQYAVLQKHSALIVDFTDVPTIGVSSSLAIEKLIEEDLGKGLPVCITGMGEEVKQRMKHMGILDKVGKTYIFDDPDSALEKIGQSLEERENQVA